MAQKRTERGSTAPTAPSGVLTLREWMDRLLRGSWREVKDFKSLYSNVKFLNERLGDRLLPAITAEVLEQFVSRMYEQGYKPGTIKRKLATLGRALKLAAQFGQITAAPPIPEVKVRNMKDRVLSLQEEERVYAAIRLRHLREPWRRWDEFEDLITVLIQTGGRLGEVLGMKTGAIALRNGTPYLTFQRYATKSDRPRTIPLTAQAHAAIERNIGEPCASGACVPGGVPIWHFNETKAWFFWSIIRKEVGGMDDVTLHTLRHTALTRLAQGGMDLMRLQKWAGHADPRVTTERYAHLQPSDLDGGLAILERSTI